MKTVSGVNKALLVAPISPRAVELRYSPNGTALAAFACEVQSSRREGATYKNYLPVLIVGKGAEDAMDLAPGDMVLVDGWLEWRPGAEGDKSSGGVQLVAWSVAKLAPMPAPVPTGATH